MPLFFNLQSFVLRVDTLTAAERVASTVTMSRNVCVMGSRLKHLPTVASWYHYEPLAYIFRSKNRARYPYFGLIRII